MFIFGLYILPLKFFSEDSVYTALSPQHPAASSGWMSNKNEHNLITTLTRKLNYFMEL